VTIASSSGRAVRYLLAKVKFGRNMDKVTAKTSELRTKGTDALLAAARDAGVRRFVAQSVAAFSRYAREGGPRQD
jgi:hypothetical protein